MRFQEKIFPFTNEGPVVRFIAPAQFNQEASEMMIKMTNHLQTLEQTGEDLALVHYISRSMGTFHQMALLRGLQEIADLAWHVSRALEQTEACQSKQTKSVVSLSLAAVSQIQALLNPSVEEAGKNAQRIVYGLLRNW